MPIGVSSAPSAKFKNPGDRHGGEIVDFRVTQTTNYKTRRPQYLQNNESGWEKVFTAYAPDGKPNDPITQWEITVDTGVENEHGDTERRIFVDPRKGKRGTTVEGKRAGDAVAVALKKAKAHRVGLEIGGRFFLIMGPKVRDGDYEVNTWTAEYEPPEGGPGSGTPVDETPWLVGGGRYDKQAELDKWERSQMPALRESVAAAQAADPAVSSPVQEAIDRGRRAHESSPVLNRPAAPPADDDEPPF